MSELKFTITAELDGQLLGNFPIIRRVQVNEAQTLAVSKAGGDGVGNFYLVPGTSVSPALNALIISTDQPIQLKTGGVVASDGVIPLQANGLIVLIGCNLASGGISNLTINNTGANPASLSGLVAGT